MLPIGLVWVGLIIGGLVASGPTAGKEAVLITAWFTGLVTGTFAALAQWVTE